MEDKDLVGIHRDRKFEVCDIDWIIDDVSLATCGDVWSIQSPEFTLTGFHVTKWLMVLTQISNKNQPRSVVFTLKRCSSDGGPKSVYVEWRLTISVSGCDEVITIERICEFGLGTEYKGGLKGLKNSIAMIKPFESDLVTIRCKMIVYDRASKVKFEPCHDKGIRCLSENLLNLFQSGNRCDLALKIGRKVILAHKAIVCTRIKKLNHLLKDADTCIAMDTIDLPNLHYEAMIKIMEYVYSGDSSHVLSEPSLGIYDNVQILDLNCLKECYCPKNLTFRSSMNAQESTFTWGIRSYLNKYDDVMTSPVFYDVCSTAWQLKLFAPSGNHFNYSSIFAENVRKARLGNTCIEFAITNEHGGTVFAKWLGKVAGDPEPFGFGKFIRRSMVRNFLTNDTLRITMKLKLPSCAMHSYIKKHNVALLKDTRKVDSFNLLYEDMQNLSDFSDFSDLLLHNKGECYGIHKCIVSARCSYFLSLLSNENTETSRIAIPDIGTDILCMLLNYIYFGTIPEDAGRQALTELCEAAKVYSLPLLADLCVEGME